MVKCPRCNSKSIYKFGKDPKTSKQKYHCVFCHRQFKLGDGIGKTVNYGTYPRCPYCNRAMSLYKKRRYYARYRCKPCRHKLNVYTIPEYTLDYIHEEKGAKLNFKRMRYSKEIILGVLKLFFEYGLSTRQISKIVKEQYNVKVSCVTVYQWTKKFSFMFKQHVDKFRPSVSKTWCIDETVIKVKGKKHYLYAVLCQRTRFALGWYFCRGRSTDGAIKALKQANQRAGFKPNRLLSDRHPLYDELAKFKPKLFKKHIKVEKFSSKLNNNKLERFFGTVKSRCKRARGFKSFNSVTCFLTLFFVYYNYFRPHMGLNNMTPSEVAGIKPILSESRWTSIFSF